MNSNEDVGHGGVNIKPTARKSIHLHGGHCPFVFGEKMGRYGCRSLSKPLPPNQLEDVGTDDVDNVMSKMAPVSNTIPIKPNILRRNSTDVASNEFSDDSDEENVLSTSSPAAFSLFYYRDEYNSATQSTHETFENRINTSHQSNTKRINSYDGDDFNHTVSSTNVVKKKRTLFTPVIVILVTIIAVVIGFKNKTFITPFDTKDYNYDEIDFYKDIKSLGAKYKINGNALLKIKTGISTISKNQDTSSFIFVYNSKHENYSPVIFNNFMEELASKTTRYLRNDSDTLKHVIVDTRNIESDIELMDLMDEVDKTGVMLVKNVNSVPSQLAMAFHYYCDEYSPLVKRSAIFFTLDSSSCSFYGEKPTHQYIEKCLSRKWSNIHEDKIGPLLTRIVNIVIDVTNIA